jgi:undecaprenyl pyrophosphate synthase
MNKKDVIIRVSGSNKLSKEFLSQVKKEAETLGLLPDSQSIRAVPDKVRKEDIKNTKAKDLKISVIGDENTVEKFLEAVIDNVSKETSLAKPSLNLKLESGGNDSKT